MTERRRSLVRILANFGRLLSTFCLGIVLVPLLLRLLGDDGFGLVGLLGSSIGIASMLNQVVKRSMIRELGTALHSNDAIQFQQVYNSALILCVFAGLASLGLFGLLLLILPAFNIPHNLLPSARWFVVATAAQSFVQIALAPPVNMLLVTERMITYSAWLVAERAAYVISALILLLGAARIEPDAAVIWYGWITACFTALSAAGAALHSGLLDRRLSPRPWLARRMWMRDLLGTGGWNTGMVAALNLHNHADAIIMNIAFGLFGSVIFAAAMRLTGYVRMVTTGVTHGLDAVAARISSVDGRARTVQLVRQSTRLHGTITFPAVAAVLILAPQIIGAWIAPHLDEPDATVPPIIVLVRILAIGVGFHSVADGWITVLYGAGKIRNYAPLVILGGVLNPALAVGFIWVAPEKWSYIGPSLAYTATMGAIHFVWIPIRAARILEVPVGNVLTPLLWPFLATLTASVVLASAVSAIRDWRLMELFGVLFVFLLVYGISVVLLILHPDERQFLKQIGRNITMMCGRYIG